MKNHKRNGRSKFVPLILSRNNRRLQYNIARIKCEILCTIIEMVKLFANSDKMTNLDKNLNEMKEEKGDLCPSIGTMYY